jgi:nitroreductase
VVVLTAPDPTYLEDGSLVMGNLMNAAHALGLGSCWIHRAKQTFELPEGKELLAKWGLPENLIGIGNCILGYEAEAPAEKPRKEGRIVKVD